MVSKRLQQREKISSIRIEVRTLTHRLWLHQWTTTPSDTLYKKGRVPVEIEMMLLEVVPRGGVNALWAMFIFKV
jgi:hypothetical protein